VKNIVPGIFATTIILFITGSGACKKESLSEIRQTSFNTSFDLQLSEKIQLTSPDRQLTVELRSLNDNRCVDLPCEYGGNATARVFMSDPDHHVEAETNLCIGLCDSQTKSTDTVSVIMDKIKYTVILKKVFGSPEKKAGLQINKN
jgi:hypothetical protein